MCRIYKIIITADHLLLLVVMMMISKLEKMLLLTVLPCSNTDYNIMYLIIKFCLNIMLLVGAL